MTTAEVEPAIPSSERPQTHAIYCAATGMADCLLLLAKEETVLQGMIDMLIEIGRCYGRNECGGGGWKLR
jgi:hypothetical protein